MSNDGPDVGDGAAAGADAPDALDASEETVATEEPPIVYVTAGLLEVLLEFARDAEPTDVSVALVATPAGELRTTPPGDDDSNGERDGPAVLDGATDEIPSPETPVFTEFYLPDAGRSVSRVFGMNLSVPPGQAGGRFVSHPTRELALSERDDFAARIVVAVPPWERESVGAFDRRGRRLPLTVLDAAPPEGTPPQ